VKAKYQNFPTTPPIGARSRTIGLSTGPALTASFAADYVANRMRRTGGEGGFTAGERGQSYTSRTNEYLTK
jgi:hypothetical protein